VLKRECAACKAKDQTIVTLADQVDYLRGLLAQQGTALPPQEAELEKILEPDFDVQVTPDMDEDEADIRWAQAHGYITPQAAEEALAQMRGAEQEIELT